MVCKKIVLKGRVQGVGMRATVSRKAKTIGATGYVQNESDGSVTILVCGTDRDVRLMVEWVKDHGPPGHVENFTIEDYPDEHYSDFTIHY